MAHSKPWTRRLKTVLLANPELRTTFSREAIEATCRSLGYHWRQSFWNPTVTLLTFLLQVLSAEKSLRAAVADLIAHRAAQGEPLRPSIRAPTARRGSGCRSGSFWPYSNRS